jgi:3-oxoacyl-[acyl-carrier protein] reductase
LTSTSTSTPLTDQVALVTGAGRGIGAAIAARLASLGARLVLCGRSRTTLDQTASVIRSHGHECDLVECNLVDLRSVESLAAHVNRTLQRLDILVNNAGIMGQPGPLLDLPPDAWDEILNTNLRGVYYMVHNLAPLMIRARRGHIINISSLAGKNPLPNGAAYAASKWGLNGLTYSLAEEFRSYNIRVSVICPGSVHTEFSPHAGKNAAKMLQPDDVAHAVAMIVTQTPGSFVSEVLLRPTLKP